MGFCSRFGLTDATALRLEALPGGADLAGVLFGLQVAELSEAALVEAVAGFERLASAAAAGQARCVGELIARRGAGSRAADGVVDEVRARLGQTGVAAQAKVDLAESLQDYPEVADALAAGTVDARKAGVLVDRQPGISQAEHRDLTKELLAEAGEKTPTWIRDRIRRHALATDPDAGRLRREQQYARRCVTVEPLPDAMARVCAYLRGDDAQRVKTTLDALADTARAPGDTRTMDQRRADTFVDLFTGPGNHDRPGGQSPVLGDTVAGTAAAATADAVTSTTRSTAGDPAARADDASRQRGGGSGAQVYVTIGAGTLLGLDDEPGKLAGHGPIPAELARRLAADATWRGLFTDATGQFTALGTRAYRPGLVLERAVKARHVRCTFPGCRQAATYADLDHIDPYDPTRARDQQSEPQTTETNLHPLCRRHHNLKTTGHWTVHSDDGPATKPGRTGDTGRTSKTDGGPGTSTSTSNSATGGAGALTWRAPTGHTYRHRPEPPPGTGRASPPDERDLPDEPRLELDPDNPPF
ncbi:HNH endonuclease signature motif containing protein [Georgenia alba]|uniref:DUF222 domain-containing protein n=1 Tax=Georgenia alba TaxID=2233858 RepID=A0ABW2Q6X8_9MICO